MPAAKGKSSSSAAYKVKNEHVSKMCSNIFEFLMKVTPFRIEDTLSGIKFDIPPSKDRVRKTKQAKIETFKAAKAVLLSKNIELLRLADRRTEAISNLNEKWVGQWLSEENTSVPTNSFDAKLFFLGQLLSVIYMNEKLTESDLWKFLKIFGVKEGSAKHPVLGDMKKLIREFITHKLIDEQKDDKGSCYEWGAFAEKCVSKKACLETVVQAFAGQFKAEHFPSHYEEAYERMPGLAIAPDLNEDRSGWDHIPEALRNLLEENDVQKPKSTSPQRRKSNAFGSFSADACSSSSMARKPAKSPASSKAKRKTSFSEEPSYLHEEISSTLDSPSYASSPDSDFLPPATFSSRRAIRSKFYEDISSVSLNLDSPSYAGSPDSDVPSPPKESRKGRAIKTCVGIYKREAARKSDTSAVAINKEAKRVSVSANSSTLVPSMSNEESVSKNRDEAHIADESGADSNVLPSASLRDSVSAYTMPAGGSQPVQNEPMVLVQTPTKSRQSIKVPISATLDDQIGKRKVSEPTPDQATVSHSGLVAGGSQAVQNEVPVAVLSSSITDSQQSDKIANSPLEDRKRKDSEPTSDAVENKRPKKLTGKEKKKGVENTVREEQSQEPVSPKPSVPLSPEIFQDPQCSFIGVEENTPQVNIEFCDISNAMEIVDESTAGVKTPMSQDAANGPEPATVTAGSGEALENKKKKSNAKPKKNAGTSKKADSTVRVANGKTSGSGTQLHKTPIDGVTGGNEKKKSVTAPKKNAGTSKKADSTVRVANGETSGSGTQLHKTPIEGVTGGNGKKKLVTARKTNARAADATARVTITNGDANGSCVSGGTEKLVALGKKKVIGDANKATDSTVRVANRVGEASGATDKQDTPEEAIIVQSKPVASSSAGSVSSNKVDRICDEIDQAQLGDLSLDYIVKKFNNTSDVGKFYFYLTQRHIKSFEGGDPDGKAKLMMFDPTKKIFAFLRPRDGTYVALMTIPKHRHRLSLYVPDIKFDDNNDPYFDEDIIKTIDNLRATCFKEIDTLELRPSMQFASQADSFVYYLNSLTRGNKFSENGIKAGTGAMTLKIFLRKNNFVVSAQNDGQTIEPQVVLDQELQPGIRENLP